VKSNDRGESQKRGTAHRVIQALFSGVLGQACGGSALANGLNGFGLSQTKGDDMNVARINIRLGGATGKTLAALAIVGSLLAGCATLPDDSKEAKVMRFNNLNNYRFCEVWLIGGDALTKDLSGAFYNTTDLNNKANPRDSCPADMWAKVDAEALKNQYNLLGVFKNGPRYWMYDWIDLPVGTERDFNGLQARWMGVVHLPKDFGKPGSTFYKSTTVHRNSKQGYAKGQTVFILDDPDGTPWVMQASSLLVDPKLTYDDLKTLDKKLKLPPGWKYRVKVLDQDLGMGVINGLAHVTQDDLENTYNACFEGDGKKNCSYQP